MSQHRPRIRPTRCGAIQRAVRLAHVLPPAASSTTPPSGRERDDTSPSAPPLSPSADSGRSAGGTLGGWCGH